MHKPALDFDSSPDSLHLNIHVAGTCTCVADDNSALGNFRRRQSQKSIMPAGEAAQRRWSTEPASNQQLDVDQLRHKLDSTLGPSAPPSEQPSDATQDTKQPTNRPSRVSSLAAAMSGTLHEPASVALNDTPNTTAPNSPRMSGNISAPSSENSDGPLKRLPLPIRQNSGTSTPRVRPTTLDIPGLTKSKVSPDGRIASRDVGSKLVIVMVGLPARGKSYITKKLARYLNWLQHDTKIFNVGERRRVAAGGPNSLEKTRSQHQSGDVQAAHSLHLTAATVPKEALTESANPTNQSTSVAKILLNGEHKVESTSTYGAIESEVLEVSDETLGERSQIRPPRRKSLATMVLSRDAPETVKVQNEMDDEGKSMEHSAAFFDPQNKKAAQIREQVARETLDELLDYILYDNGSVGILDATNSTLQRRKMVMDRIRERAGPQLNVLFLESSCVDPDLLEANMRLKLNGPDYKEMDPVIALEDFRKRVREYEKSYVPLGEYEETNNMPYIQMVDVGRKVISHQIKGFLMAQANYYLLNFNLAPRQIWITRHGLSEDNISGKIGGDSDLAPEGHRYAKALSRFMGQKRQEWDMKQLECLRNTHFPPQPGDSTPPNPYYHPQSPGPEGGESVLTDATELGFEPKAFCVWTSMLKRSIQTAQYFNDEEYDTKQMRMLDELNAGVMEGLTYSCISTQFPEEYKSRKRDKLQYRYPGPGGEGYLDIINRLRPVIVELERMTDHILLIGHRSVARVLLAYFRGLDRETVADLDVPIGMLYCLEPKPYGVEFHGYRWDKDSEWFYEVPNFKLRRAEDDMM